MTLGGLAPLSREEEVLGTGGWKARIPWFLVFALVLLPLYAATAAFTIRSGIFNLSDRSITADEYKAFWAFLASGFTTAVSLVGLMLTRTANERASSQVGLDTAVKGLDLLVDSEGKYAPRAKVAGALAALVHLGHPVISMRSLAVAWDDGAADPATACWLISEVFRRGSNESKLEASKLLLSHADRLAGNLNQNGTFTWPDVLYDEWPLKLPMDARSNNLESILKLMLSRPKNWWEKDMGWIYYDLYLAARFDKRLRSDALTAIEALWPLIQPYFEFGQYIAKDGRIMAWKDMKRVRRRRWWYRDGYITRPIQELTTAIQTWMQQDENASGLPKHPHSGLLGDTPPAEGGLRPPAGRP